MRSLVIVESFSKSQTIAKYLGPGYTVKACFGHVQDLPRKDELTAEHAALPWASLGVNVEGQFELLYVTPTPRPGEKGTDKRTLLQELAMEARRHDEVILATDPDREGEAIAYHLAQQLRLGRSAKRVTFNEVTEDAIKQAISRPRQVNMDLVHAQEARRAVDRLSGYKISPVVSRVVMRDASAGRVQSVALAALAAAEWARLGHVAASYVRVTADLGEPGQTFTAQLVQFMNRPVATPKDYQANGQLKAGTAAAPVPREAGEALAQRLSGQALRVTAAEQTPFTTRPAPPFTTASLQQQASTQLKLNPSETMDLAQQLYECGLITYMRTDSVSLSEEGTQGAREAAVALFGTDAVPATPRRYVSKAKNSQEAHEAVRPSKHFTPPDEARLDGKPLSGKLAELYGLIYRRTVASQMADKEALKTSLYLAFGEEAVFGAVGRTVVTPGFSQIYEDVSAAAPSDDPKAGAGQGVPLLTVGDTVRAVSVQAEVRATPAPPRFTQAGLVQALEGSGVGRPSTYASILQTLLDRGYVTVQKDQMYVTWAGLLVNDYLKRNFATFLNPEFTSQMEGDLDKIASGENTYLAYMTVFWRQQLAPTLAQASSAPPFVELPRVPGARVIMVIPPWKPSGKSGEQKPPRGIPTLCVGDARVDLPAGVMPEDLNTDIVQRILNGETTFKKGKKTK